MTPGYIDIMRWFWDEAPHRDGYKSEYGILCFALLDSINRNEWKEAELEYEYIIFKSRIGKRMYLSGRQWLDDNGFIAFKAGRGDYAKARFKVHSAVLDAVQKRTAKRTAKRGNAVQDEVQKRTTPDTASSTASDTASRTYNTEDLIRPERPLRPEDDNNVVANEKIKKSNFQKLFSEENKKKEFPPPSPGPPPFTWEVLANYLWELDAGKQEMELNLKPYTDEGYATLVFGFLSQKFIDGKGWLNAADCATNFQRWIPYQKLNEPQTKKVLNGNGNNNEKNQRSGRNGFQTAVLNREDGF